MSHHPHLARVLAIALLAATAHGFAAEQSWTGTISDDMCKTKHESGGEGGPAMSEHDCTLACVKGGSKFVFVSDGKICKIANQDLADLRKHAGEKVTITGDMKGDSITVASVTP